MSDTFSERSYINTLQSLIDEKTNVLGHFEDAVAIQIDEEYLVINIDGWVASTDRPPGLKLEDCGYRAVANAVSDVIVKGAKPEGMIISMSFNKEYHGVVEKIFRGFSEASDNFAVPYLGGDLNSANDLVIDVTVWGKTEKLIRRSGARPGEYVYWLGPSMGSTAAALGILTRGWIGERKRALEIMGKPKLFPEFITLDVTASIDCSDGLARSLYLLANASSVGIELDGSIPVDQWVHRIALQNNQNYSDLIFYGGEELGIVFTASNQSSIPDYAIQLGRVIEGNKISLDGEILRNKGWDHFSIT